jgi:nucleoid-associated protein EbfC
MKGMQNIMKQANQMQLKMKKLQEELATREYEGTAGGDGVKVKVKGESEIVAVHISPDAMKAGDVEMLQDLIMAAANHALKTAKDASASEMQKITGGFNMPGMF